MTKKGLFFTLVTLVLFLSLLFLSQSYFTRSKTTEEKIAIASVGSKMHAFESDIASDFFNIVNVSLLNLTKVKVNNNPELMLYFNHFGILPRGTSIDIDMRNYTNITQSIFAPLSNVDLSFELSFSGFFICLSKTSLALVESTPYLFAVLNAL